MRIPLAQWLYKAFHEENAVADQFATFPFEPAFPTIEQIQGERIKDGRYIGGPENNATSA